MLSGTARGGYFRSRRRGGARGGSAGSGSPGTGRLWLQDGAETHRLQRHQHSGSSWCCPSTQGATSSGKHNLHKCVHKRVRSPRRAAHPHPPSSLQACMALAARAAAPARRSLPGSGLFPQPPYARFAGLNALFIGTAGARGFTQNARDAVLLQRPAGSCRGVEGCCGVPKVSSFSSSPGGTRPRRLDFLHRGAAVRAGTPVEGDVPPERCHILSGAVSRVVPVLSGARSILLRARAVFGRIWALPWFMR